MKIELVLVLALMILFSSCEEGKQQANTILDKLDVEFDPPASTLTAFRVALDIDPDVQTLVSSNVGAAAALDRLDSRYLQMDDNMVAICAYILEKQDYRVAIHTLETYLLSNPGNRHHVWGPPVSVTALLKLKGIPDASGGYDGYDDATIENAIWGP